MEDICPCGQTWFPEVQNMGIRNAIRGKVEELRDYLEKEEKETDRIIVRQILEEEMEDELEDAASGRYDTNTSDLSISGSIRSLDHIQWFLEHQNGYDWKDGKEEIQVLSRLMKDRKKNRQEIIEVYLQILRRFQNDPFRTFIILDDADETAAKGSSIDRFFVVVDKMPVPIGFVRQFDRNMAMDLEDAFDRKKQALKSSAEELYGRVREAVVPEQGDVRSYQRKAAVYIFISACLSAALLILCCMDIVSSHYRPGVEFLRRYLPDVRTCLQILKAEYNLRWYLVCGGMAGISAVVFLLLLISVFRTASRYISAVQNIRLPAEKKEDLEMTFGQDLKMDIDLLDSIVRKAFDRDIPVQKMKAHDYRDKVQMIQEIESLDLSGQKPPVSAGGRFLQVICMVLIAWFICRSAGILPDTEYGRWAATGYVEEYDLNR